MTDLLANDVAKDDSLFDPVQSDMSLANTTSSEKNLMAQSAIIKGEDPVESYAELAGMSDEERKVETLAIKEEADLLEQEANIAMIGDLLADPELAVEKKEAIISGVPGIKPTSSLQRTAEILHTKVSGRETESQERRLATVSELIAPTVEMMTLKQKVINAFSYDEDGDSVSLVNNLGDFAELFTPFLEQAYMYQIRQQVGSGEISTTQDLLNAVMLGEAKVDAREAYKDMTPDERKEFLENALNIFNSTKTFNIFNDNDLIQLDNLLSITQEGYYGTTERVLEDIGSVIDAIPALNIIYRAGLKPISKIAKAKTISMMQKAGLRRTASSKQPASVTSLAEQVNPEVARDMAKAVADDETGEVAEVLTGSSKTEAEVEMHGPQPATPDGSVLNKPFAMDRRVAEAAYEETGKIYRTPGELARLATKLDRELAEVRSIVRSDEMHTSPIVMDNGNLKISETYTTPDGGFHSPEDALKAVVQNLEYYGVKETDVTILRRVGDEYVPTSVKEVAGKKEVRETIPKTVTEEVAEELSPINMQDDYIARVDFDYAPRAIDFVGDIDGVKIRDDLDVGVLNFLDTLSSKAPTPGGSTASRWLFQFSHLLHPTITKASGSVVDQSNRLHKVMSDLYKEGVADPLKNLPNERAERLIKVMEDQNIARKNYTLDELEDLGIVEANELQILQNWKYVNDQNWHLANRDTNMSLRSKGYVRYVDKDNGDEFVGKILKPNEKRPNTVYDPATGKTKLSKDVWDELEATGGKVFTLRSPQIIDDVEVRHIIVRGEEGSRYLKSIQLDDVSLPYIPGHYHISYRDHYFIKRTLVDEAGNDVPGTTQAIMTAPETKSAQAVVDRFSENAKSAGKGRTWRYELEAGRELDPVDLAMRRFEVNEHAGLSSQRKRGETLRSFDSSNPTDLSPKIADPLEAHKQSIAELAKRVPMREYLEDLEQRIITRYGKVLPKNEYGKPKLPNSSEKLKGAGTKDAKLMADARTMIEHYNYMKFGYFNGIDTAWRKSLLRTSQVAGKVSRRLEKSIMGVADEFPSFIGALKGMTFNAHIALSAPPSQWMVQGLPALMNTLLHPSYVASGKIVRDMSRLKTALVAGDDAKLLRKVYGDAEANEMLALRADWERSGLGVGVDKHLIVEHGLEGMIGTNKLKRTKAVHDAIVDTGRKMGFDVGETFQLMAFFLANRNDAIKSGKSMSNARHFDEVRAKTRTMTMNMNKAGEMPWNKNSLSLWTQFMISPYKSLTMMLDRGLTTEERIKIGTWQLLVMPLPIYMTSHIRAFFGVTGEEGDFATEVITNGLLGGSFNTLANAIYKDAGSASWQRNVQIDPTFSGPLTFLHELSKDPQGVSTIQKIAQMSPTLALINPDGYNPVVFNMAKSFGRLIASPVVDDYEALKEMKAFGDAVFQSTALTRGLSTAYKDQFTNEARKRYSAISGKLQDEDVSWMESLARGAAGMETTTQLVDREVNARLYDGSAEAKKDVDLIIAELSREATIEGFNVGDPKRAEYILSNFSLAFPDGRVPPKTASYLLNKLDPSMSLTQKMLTGYGYGVEEVEKLTKVLGSAHPEAKAMYDYIQSEKAVQDLLEED